MNPRELYDLYKTERGKEIVRFLLAGGGCFIFEYVLLYVLTEYVSISYLISAGIAFTISLIVNYILCTTIVFHAGEKNSTEMILFATTSLLGLGINQITMWFFVEIVGIWYMFAKVIASALVMIWNYFTKRYILHGRL